MGNGKGQAAKAAGKVSAAVLASRLLGLAREMVFSRLLGAGMAMDALRVAFLIPNLLRDLVAEGALSSAFVPTFTDYLRNKSKSQAWVLASLVMSLLIVLLGFFALLLALFPDQAMLLAAMGFADDPDKAELTARLIQILSPFLLFVALASVAMGVLNAFGHFFLPALAPAFFNLAVIAAGLALAPWMAERGYNPAVALALGMLAGGMLQFAVQVPLMRRHGFRFRFRLDFEHPGMRRIGRLIGPAVAGVSAVQVNVLVNTQMASYLTPEDGPVSWLQYAFRILYLPIGLFGVAVGVVNLRNVSVWASQQDWGRFKETVADSLKLVSLLALPSTAGLLVLAEPAVRTLFEGGRFLPSDTRATAYALICYALALAAYSCQKVYVPSFYALDDTRTPVRISLVAVAVNLTFNVIVVFLILDPIAPRYAYLGLALGTSVSVTLQVILLARALRRRLGTLAEHRVGGSLMRMGVAAAVMGAVVWGLLRLLESGLPDVRWAEAATLALCVSAGGLAYFGICLALGVEEVRWLADGVRRRLGGRKPADNTDSKNDGRR